MTKNAGDKLAAMYLRAGILLPALRREEHPTIFLLSDPFRRKISENPEMKAWLGEHMKYSRYEKRDAQANKQAY